ncbi:MAG: S-layer homology domain-containing protein, partial [Bacillota bacterium]|nr:S-layer homology domain-containing protein [Bacillota bacterium]
TDISGHWARQYIDYVVGKGLLTGTSATSFSPELSVNRAMIVTVLWRLEGKPSATGSVSFKDVNGSDYYRDAVNWAVEKGIVKGRSGSTFDPNADVSRQEIAVFLYRYASYKGKGTDKTGNLTGYADKGSISDWALSAMDSVVGGGIITGRGANTLAPQGSAKRGEFAAMLYRYCN